MNKEDELLKTKILPEDLDEDFDDDEDDLLDIEDEEVDIKIVTDLSKIKKKKESTTTTKRKPKVIGKHTLAYDTIHNSKRDDDESLEEEYYINDISYNFEVSSSIDTSENYSSDDYYFSIELKKKVFQLLVEHTDIDFSPDKKRRIPSVNDLNAYYKLLIDELSSFRYSHTEIFMALSEFFSDKIWNVYKKMNSNYKNIITNELQEKYQIEEINQMDFL